MNLAHPREYRHGDSYQIAPTELKATADTKPTVYSAGTNEFLNRVSLKDYDKQTRAELNERRRRVYGAGPKLTNWERIRAQVPKLTTLREKCTGIPEVKR